MAPDKDEYPSLLPDGLHVMTVAELRALCVTSEGFAGSSTRSDIMDRLERAIRMLVDGGIDGEVWVNGSFLTQKLDPEDVDITVRIDAAVYDAGTAEQRALLDWITSLRDTEKVDGYLQPEWPVGHPNYALGQQQFDYWRKQWGISRSGTPKGIAVVKLTGRLP